MKPLILLLFYFLMPGGENEWKVSLDKDDIIVYTRDVESSPFDEFLVQGEVRGDIQQFRKIITNIERYTEWLPDCKSAVVIENPSPDDITYHMKLKVPFPFANRDIIQQINIHESGRELIVEITNRPAKIKKEENYVRMQKADGRWTIQQLSADRIFIKFQYLADPGGGVPPWLVNTFLVKNPHKTLQNIREMMGE
jgi:ribosome-associated toxin RatA of RatAB toxin-antitoxin module